MSIYDGQDWSCWTPRKRNVKPGKCKFPGCPNLKAGAKWCHAHEKQGEKGGRRRPLLDRNQVRVPGVFVSQAHFDVIRSAAGDGTVGALVKKWVIERAEIQLALANHAKEVGTPGATLAGDTYKILWLLAERRSLTVHELVVQAVNEWAALNRPKPAIPAG